MIYTIGHEDSYESYFRDYETPKKAEGGSVWRTREAAEACTRKDEYALRAYKVYGVVAIWRYDTELDPDGDGWDRLLRAMPLVKLDDRVTDEAIIEEWMENN